jgi:hypothetical protein
VFIRHHDNAFDVLQMLAETGAVTWTHVDAHSDLGLGDPGYIYLLTEVAHLAQSARAASCRARNEPNEANWLPFAVANGWISSVTFVPRRYPPEDLHPWFLPAGLDRLVVVQAQSDDRQLLRWHDREKALEVLFSRPVAASASFRIVDRKTFTIGTPPDFVIVSQSPQYTPKSADRVLDACARRLTIDASLQSKVTAPIDWTLTLPGRRRLEVWCFSAIPSRSRRRASSPTGSRLRATRRRPRSVSTKITTLLAICLNGSPRQIGR